MLAGLQRFISPEPETGDTFAAHWLHVGSKVVAIVGILVFFIGIALLALTFSSEDRIETTGTITEIVDLPNSDLQRVTIGYLIDQVPHSKSETTSGFRELNHKVGDNVKLLVSESDVILVEALPALRTSFIKTSIVGMILIVASVFMRKMSRRN